MGIKDILKRFLPAPSATFHKRMDSMQAELRKSRKEVQKAERSHEQIVKISADLEALQQKISNLEVNTERVHSSLEEVSQKHDKLQIDIERLEYRDNDIKKMVEDIKNNTKKLRKENSTILSNYSQLKNNIQYSNIACKMTDSRSSSSFYQGGDIDKQNVIYVADNRNRLNWGCRATSMALAEMIGVSNRISHTISGRYTLGKREFTPFIGKDGKSKVTDFVTENMEESVNNLLESLPYNPQLEELNLLNYTFDALVINGEGTMIMTTPPRRDTLIYLMLVWWACKLGKKVYFVNAMFSDCPRTGCNEQTLSLTNSILSRCTLLAVRDPVSLEYVNTKLLNCRAIYIPDALFTWYKDINIRTFSLPDAKYVMPYLREDKQYIRGFDFTNPYICISGGSMAARDKELAERGYIEFINRLKEKVNFPVCLIQACEGDSFLKLVAEKTETYFIPAEIPILSGASILANATLFISGRYHPSIMALLGGTPCIFFKSNSHKTLSLQQMLEYDVIKEFSAIPCVEEYEELFSLIQIKLESGSKERKRISDKVLRLTESAVRIKSMLD